MIGVIANPVTQNFYIIKNRVNSEVSPFLNWIDSLNAHLGGMWFRDTP